jgi:hypothetical protein
MERASAMPPMRLNGFFPTHVESVPIDISCNTQTRPYTEQTNERNGALCLLWLLSLGKLGRQFVFLSIKVGNVFLNPDYLF